MNRIVFVGVLCFVFNSIGQTELISKQILFRGIENDVMFVKNDVSEYFVDCQNCDTFYLIDENHYMVTPGMGRVVIINFYTVDSLKNKIYTIKYPLAHVPDPVLFVGESTNGTRVNIGDNILSVRYRSDFNIAMGFNITKWSLYYGDIKVDGEGDELNDSAISVLSNLDKGQVFSVIATVKDEQGISRLIGGAFSVAK